MQLKDIRNTFNLCLLCATHSTFARCGRAVWVWVWPIDWPNLAGRWTILCPVFPDNVQFTNSEGWKRRGGSTRSPDSEYGAERACASLLIYCRWDENAAASTSLVFYCLNCAVRSYTSSSSFLRKSERENIFTRMMSSKEKASLCESHSTSPKRSELFVPIPFPPHTGSSPVSIVLWWLWIGVFLTMNRQHLAST